MAQRCDRCGGGYTNQCKKCGAWCCFCPIVLKYHIDGDCLR